MTREEEKKWLAQLKVGDEVATGIRGTYFIYKVTKVTAHYICTKHSRFRKDSGRLVGSSGFNVQYIRPVTDETRRDVEQRRLASQLNHVNWKVIPVPTLQAIVTLVTRAQSGHE